VQKAICRGLLEALPPQTPADTTFAVLTQFSTLSLCFFYAYSLFFFVFTKISCISLGNGFFVQTKPPAFAVASECE
jgi:hypothetical protein